MTDQVFRDQFGMTPLQLGRELLSSMQLPQLILKTLQDIPEETRNQLGTTPTGALMIAAELGLRMAETLATQAVTPEDFGACLAETTREYPKEYRLTSQDAADLLKDVVSQISSFAQAGNFSKNTVVLFQRMECLSEERTPPTPSKPLQTRSNPSPGPRLKKSIQRSSQEPKCPHGKLWQSHQWTR